MLPKFVDAALVERCLDHCLVRRLATVAEIRKLILSFPARAVKGRRLLLDLLADREEGTGHRSGVEQRIGRWLRSGGVRGWARNFVVEGADVEVDFAWPNRRLALEISPFFTHGSRKAQARDAERRKRLVAAGWRVIEAVDADIAHPLAFRSTLATLKGMLQIRSNP